MNIFDIINVPLGWIMRICYQVSNNYLVALFLFTIAIQVVLLPFAIKQQKNSVRQAQLAPKTEALRKKYAGRNDAATQQKMQEEIQELYKRENFNPASGCFTLLIQLPIMYALYYVVMNPLRYITGLTATQITELATYMKDTLGYELSARSQYLDILNRIHADGAAAYTSIVPGLDGMLLPKLQLGGVDFSLIPTVSFKPIDWLMLVPILTFVFAMLMQWVTRKFTYQTPEAIAAQNSPSMKIMNVTFPLLSVWIAFSVPAGIGIYWIFRNIITAVQQIILSKLIPAPHFTEEDYKQAEKEMKVGRPVREKSKIPPRSLHRIDDEEYQAKIAAAKAGAEEEAPAEAVTEAPAQDAQEKKEAQEAGDGTAAAPVLKEDVKANYEKKITPASGPKYAKTGKNYKK